MEYLEIINSNTLQENNIYYVILKYQFKYLFKIVSSIRCGGNLNRLREEICLSILNVDSIDEAKYFEIQNLIKKNLPLLSELRVDDLDELNKYIKEMNDNTIDYIVEQYYTNRILILYYNGYLRFDGHVHLLDIKSIFYKDRTFEFWLSKNIQNNAYNNQIDLMMAEKKFKVDFIPYLRRYLNEIRPNLRTTNFWWCNRDFVEVYDKKGKKSFNVNDHPFKIMVSPIYELHEVVIFLCINYRFYNKKGYIKIEKLISRLAHLYSSQLSPYISGIQTKRNINDIEKEYLEMMDEKYGLINYTIIPTYEVNVEIITKIIDEYDKNLIELEQIDDEVYLSIYEYVENSNDVIPGVIENSLTTTEPSRDMVKSSNLLVSIKDDELLSKALIRMYIDEMYMLSVIREYYGKTNRVSYSFMIARHLSNFSPVLTPYKYLSHFRELDVEEILMFFDTKIEEFPDLASMLISTEMVRDYLKIIKKKKSLACLNELEDYLIENCIKLYNNKLIIMKRRKNLLLIDHENDQEIGIELLEKLFDKLKL